MTDYTAATAQTGTATGFRFEVGNVGEMVRAVGQAVDLYRRDADAWRRLQLAGMRQDWSWEHSAAEYVNLYKRATPRAQSQ